jgi:peptidylprolyl isomerase
MNPTQFKGEKTMSRWIIALSVIMIGSWLYAHNPTVVLETNRGNITLELYPEIAPKAVENFMGLVKQGYYDGIIFHRVISNFMIQGGDPTGTGRGGRSIWKKPFEDEFSKKVRFDRSGILAMANAGPHTNGSQFFITTKPTPWLNGRHTIFGTVSEGYLVVQKIESARTGNQDKPITEQKILKAYIK